MIQSRKCFPVLGLLVLAASIAAAENSETVDVTVDNLTPNHARGYLDEQSDQIGPAGEMTEKKTLFYLYYNYNVSKRV